MRSQGRSRRLLPLVVATAITLMVLDAAGFGPIGDLRRTALTVGDPIAGVLGAAVRPVTGVWHGAVHYDDLEEENRELRRRNAELAGALAGQPDSKTELEALLDATEIDYLGDVERVTARVVADRQSDIERLVEIDKGRDDGIAERMPVVTGTGLVGVVELATAGRSVIRLLTDVELAVGVRNPAGLGLATGAGEGPLEFVPSPELADAIRAGLVRTGARFVTSGVDRSIYPSGIPVGSLVITDPETGRTEGGSPSPAGPEVSVSGQAADAGGSVLTPGPGAPTSAPPTTDVELPIERFEIRLEPLASLDRLGYVTVILVGPEP